MRIRTSLVAVAAIALLTGGVIGQEDTGAGPKVIAGRSKIATKYGIVAASQPLAARAGVQILERGGNAIDAAIATNAVMGLVEPHNNGIGGDLFAIYYEARTGKLYGLNSGGWAPTGLTPDLLKSKGIDRMPGAGIYTVTVPGAVAGWDAMRSRFGKLPLSDLLAPGDLLRRRRLSGHRCHRGRVGRPDAQARRRSERRADVPAQRPRAARRGSLQEPAAGRVAAPDRREGTGRFLRGEDRRCDRRHLAREGRDDDARRPEGVQAGMGRSDLDDLSRLERLRAAAEHAGHRRADDAERDGAVPARAVRLPQREGAARHDRGEEARLCRHAAVRRRSALREGAGPPDVEQGAREGSRAPHRSGEGGVQRRARAPRRADQPRPAATRSISPSSTRTATSSR